VLRVNVNDGRTLHFDLEDSVQASQWHDAEADPAFQSAITGIGIIDHGVVHTLSLPRHFHRLAYRAELVKDGERVVGERLDCQADDVLLSLLIYRGNSVPMVRVNLDKLGWRRFDRQTRSLARR